MRTRRALAATACLLLPMLAIGHPPEVTLPSFDALKSSAQDSVDITFGRPTLGLLGWLIDDSDADGARLKQTVRGLKSVQIRSFEFKNGFEYPKAELDALRAQLLQPAWSQLVKVRDRGQKENVDIYVALQDHTVEGVTVIACGARELTIINVIGSIELDQVDVLRKMFGHPDGRMAQVSQRTP